MGLSSALSNHILTFDKVLSKDEVSTTSWRVLLVISFFNLLKATEFMTSEVGLEAIKPCAKRKAPNSS